MVEPSGEVVDFGGLDPIDKWDDPTYIAGIPRLVYLQYLGLDAPRAWTFRLPQGVVGERLQVGDRFAVDVIDTWNTPTSVERNTATADAEPWSFPQARRWRCGCAGLTSTRVDVRPCWHG